MNKPKVEMSDRELLEEIYSMLILIQQDAHKAAFASGL